MHDCFRLEKWYGKSFLGQINKWVMLGLLPTQNLRKPMKFIVICTVRLYFQPRKSKVESRIGCTDYLPSKAHSPLGIKAVMSPPSSFWRRKSIWNTKRTKWNMRSWWTTNYLEPVVRPAPELHITILIIKREPCDVYWAGRHEYTGRDVGAGSVTRDDHVGGVRCIKRLACTT